MNSSTKSVIGLRSCDIILGYFSDTLLLLVQCLGCERLLYIWIPTSRVRAYSSSNWGIFALLARLTQTRLAKSIAIIVIVRFCSVPMFADTISQGYSSAAQQWLAMMDARYFASCQASSGFMQDESCMQNFA